MKYLDEYRDPDRARGLLSQIRSAASRRWVLMEVCGGQTHSLLRYGIETELEDTVELIHGPGCPVCVTPIDIIDRARQIASLPGLILATFGDMLRVPGSSGSLSDTRAAGGDVRTVYSPLDAVTLAKRHPDREVVLLAVGFETTAPATALALLHAERLNLQNFSVLVSHVRVQPAMELIMQSPANRVQAFLAAGHVCTITGYDCYGDFSTRWQTPVVVAGFEPVDLLEAILECVNQLETGRYEVVNCYARTVRTFGNETAQDIVDRVYEIADRRWRGLGTIAAGGLQLKPPWRKFDAEERFALCGTATAVDDSVDLCGEVLTGRVKPPDCPAFGNRCTPGSPLGAPMVSSEGACAAYYRYHCAADSSAQRT